MGTIHPSDEPRGDAPHSERLVYAALKAALPDGWRAWHSVRVRDRRRVRYEADFIVAAPDRGWMALEVKGGRVHLDDGHWYQDGRRLDKSPLWQAENASHELRRELGRRGAAVPPSGAAVVLPHSTFSHGPSGGGLPGAVLGEQDLPHLESALRAAFDAVVPPGDVPPPGPWMDAIHTVWGEHWVPELLGLRDRAAAAERRLLRLTDDQIDKLDVVLESARQLVYGAAGSGKTVLARELCLRRAGTGQRALYLCFTRALGGALRLELDGHPDPAARGITARNVRQLAYEILVQCECPTRPGENSFWEECALDAAQAVERGCEVEEFDLVVVDEAQDFSEADWCLVEALVAHGAHLWAFADEGQRFWTERTIPAPLFEHAGTLRLRGQHRNPPEIEAFANRYRSGDETTAAEPARVDKKALSLVVVDADGRRDKVAGLIERWRVQGASPEEIAVVCLAGQTKSAIVGSGSLGKERAVTADHADAGSSVVADTFLRFKGFERPFVIVTELGGEDERSAYDTRMYIALTRATVQVIVVATPDELAGDERLSALPRRG